MQQQTNAHLLLTAALLELKPDRCREAEARGIVRRVPCQPRPWPRRFSARHAHRLRRRPVPCLHYLYPRLVRGCRTYLTTQRTDREPHLDFPRPPRNYPRDRWLSRHCPSRV